MKTARLTIVIFFCLLQMMSYSQEESEMTALVLPVRNSLTFNRFVINPTFSFVREQHKYISVFNKREWVQFEDAPQTYLASYNGRLGENVGGGVALFQQNFGVFTTFGGVANFAYNARLGQDSNLTFGMNVGAYRSGLNNGNVVTNRDSADPSLNNLPSSTSILVNPGINYGTTFLDIGVSVNNLAVYNFEASELISDNPEQAIQGHLMYTGYMTSGGFFDEAKFSGLVKSEFKKEETVVSGIAMLSIPKGIWAQVGYNNLYGASGGLGINITPEVSMEYSYEKAVGALANFGSSHEFTLAYRFKNKDNYYYSGDEDVAGLFSDNKKKRRVTKSPKAQSSTVATETDPILERKRKLAAIAKAKKERKSKKEAKQKKFAEKNKEREEAKLAAKAKVEEELFAQAEADIKEREEAKLELKAKEKQAIATAEAQARAEVRAILEARKQAKESTQVGTQLETERLATAKARKAADAKAREEARAAEAKATAERLAKEKAEAEAKEAARQKAVADAKAKAEAQAKLAAEKARKAAEAKAREEARAAIAKAAAEAEAQAQADLKEREAANAEAATLENLINEPTDEIGKSIKALIGTSENLASTQADLLEQLNNAVAIKDSDLKNLKEENDLSEKGIYKAPQPFKSITAENEALEKIKSNLDATIKSRNEKLKELETLYDEEYEAGTITNDAVMLYYKKKIDKLKAEQVTAIKTRQGLITKLKSIKVGLDFERKRRIKRASFNNEEDRFEQDRAALKTIKENTTLSQVPLRREDFDFGEAESGSIKILKNVNNVENGYYVIIATHAKKSKRDEFLRKAVASGRNDINFFYDVNTSRYYIYYIKSDSIKNATAKMKLEASKPYNNNMSIIKIEN